jgi:hypothetical protein
MFSVRPEYELRVEVERRKDMMMEAEATRLRARLPVRESFLESGGQRLLASLGESLVIWGDRLRVRYAAPGVSSAESGRCAPGHCRLAEPLRIAVPAEVG